MLLLKSLKSKKLASLIKKGGVGVLPTDTLYGIVGSALLPQTVESIYRLRKRDSKKPMIILVSSLSQLNSLGIKTDSRTGRFLSDVWPQKLSVILDCKSNKFSYLHRGTKTLALRMPAEKDLLKLINKTGPLVAPSANLEGKKPSLTIKEARKYFGDKIDFYVDNGKINSLPSTLISIKNRKVKILRQGNVKLLRHF